METTFFKYLEFLEIQIKESTDKLYNQESIDNMSQEEYDSLDKMDNFFENNEIDFRVSSSINLENMHLNEELFIKKLKFIMYDIGDNLPNPMLDWFYLNIYLNDIHLPQINTYTDSEDKQKYFTYEEPNEMPNTLTVKHKVIDHYIECEAYRTMIYLLQNGLLQDVSNRKKLLKYIIHITSRHDNNYTMYLNILKDLILNKELFYKSKKSYTHFQRQRKSDIVYDILASLNIEEKKVLSHKVYKDLDVAIKIYQDDNYVEIKNKIKENLHLLAFDCILIDYCKEETQQFQNLKKGLEVGLELIALSIQLKKDYANKKQRVKKSLLKEYKKSSKHDLAILQVVYYFNEHNAHKLQFLAVSLSHYLALTYEESFKVLKTLGFYTHESAYAKKGKFREHFKFLQEAYNSNFGYLN